MSDNLQNRDVRCYLTNAGRAAELKAIENNKAITITHMIIDADVLPDSADPKAVTQIANPAHSPIPAWVNAKVADGELNVISDIPADVGGFHINGIGYALADGTIYAYARGMGDYKRQATDGQNDVLRIECEIKTQNSAHITHTYDASKLYVNHFEFNEYKIAHIQAADPHTQYQRKDHAATESEIDSKTSSTLKHITLSMLWRALNNAFTGRRINTTGPLKGGRNLAGDVTLSVDRATTNQLGVTQLTDADGSSSNLAASQKLVNWLKTTLTSLINTKHSEAKAYTDTKHGQAINHANIKKGEAIAESKKYADSTKFAKSGGDLSGDIHIKKDSETSAEIKLSENHGGAGAAFKYDAVSNQAEFYTWSDSAKEWFMRVARATKNVLFAGEIYANSNKRVYHDDYHPSADNADKLNGKTAGVIVSEANGYTNRKHNEQQQFFDQKISEIYGGVAPENLDSIVELGKKLEDNKGEVLGVLNNKLDKTARAVSSGHSGYIEAHDERGVKPNTTGISAIARGVKAFFADNDLSGINGASKYYDLLVLDSYQDQSGGKPNALAFGKVTKDIYHLQPSFDGSEWGDLIRIYTSARPPTANEVGAFDKAQSNSRFLSKTESIALGTTQGVRVGRHHAVVGGGSFETTTTPVAGAIKITLPVSWTSAMITFHVDIYNYDKGTSTTFFISGYNYQGEGGRWHNTSAIQLSSDTGEQYTVRFGHDGSKCCVYIGELSKRWSYPQIIVHNFHHGYGSLDGSLYDNDWNISFSTEFKSITQTQSSTLPASSNANKLGGLEKKGYQISHKWVTNRIPNSYKTVAKVEGSRLASMIRLSGRGTTDGTVVAFTADIIVNHSNDIIIYGMCGNYTPVSIRVLSDSNDKYYIQLKRDAGTAAVDIEFNLLPLGGTADGDKVTPYLNGTATPSNYSNVKELALVNNRITTTGSFSANGIYDGSHRVYSAGNPQPRVDRSTMTDYLVGNYVGGGLELPEYFGAGKAMLQMLNTVWGWADTLWLSSYSGSDVKASAQLVISKIGGIPRIGLRRQNFDSKSWGNLYEIFHDGRLPTLTQLGAASASSVEHVGKCATANGSNEAAAGSDGYRMAMWQDVQDTFSLFSINSNKTTLTVKHDGYYKIIMSVPRRRHASGSSDQFGKLLINGVQHTKVRADSNNYDAPEIKVYAYVLLRKGNTIQYSTLGSTLATGGGFMIEYARKA